MTMTEMEIWLAFIFFCQITLCSSCIQSFDNFLQILFFYSKQGEEDFDENGDDDGNGIFDDANKIGNNGDNNGKPMEES